MGKSIIILRVTDADTRSKGNTLAPNGFSYTASIIPAGTTLYHARTDAYDPTSPEWLAFDAQMSYGLMAGIGGTTYLRTYRSTRALGPLLYFNGMSAAMLDTGTFDSQNLLLDGYVVEDDPLYIDDYKRAKRLCEEVAPRIGVEGFVRMNAGFELLWCDWSTGIELVLNNNVTAWGKMFEPTARAPDPSPPPSSPELGSDYKDSKRTSGPLPPPADHVHELFAARQSPSASHVGNFTVDQLDEPTPKLPPWHPPYGPYGGRGNWLLPFYKHTTWEWLRSTTAVYAGSGETRVRIFPSTFITAYGRAGLDLSSPDPSTHRLVNRTLAPATAEAILDDVARAMADFRNTSNAGSDLNTDWRGITDQIVNQYGRRLPELHALLRNGTASAIQRAQFSLVTMLVPSYVPFLSLTENRAACADTFLYGLDTMTLPERERTTLRAIRSVQADICGVLLKMMDDLLPSTTEGPVSSDLPPEILERNAEQLLQLMARLRWDMWVQCEKHCSYAQVCRPSCLFSEAE